MGTWTAEFTLPSSGSGGWTNSGNSNPAECIDTASDAEYSYIQANASGNTVGWYSLGTVAGSLPSYCSITTMYMTSRICRTGTSAGSGTIEEYNGTWGTMWSGTWPGYSNPNRTTQKSWTRGQAAGMYMYAHHNGDGSSSRQIRADWCQVVFTWAYYVQNGHDITSFSGIDTEGATANMHYHANGDGLTDYYVEWGNAPSTYQHNTGWIRTGLSGTGDQNPTKHITGEAPGAMVYVRFRTRNCDNTGVVYCPEHSFRTLGGTAQSCSMVG
jgi:hypothetical protein